ncbi:baseplate assembly protein [Serratia marcescens]|uniref:Baseplate assembly protein n=1 Tax=Serratia marcescens TaxID=615 RepID=A0A5C7CCU0_SERMA|nr:baseplate J/gp47 family protein [Serratia marcescens]TXE33253.1 baseplate assembly protein [Serratia marcescens]TXE65223.1 baseplate assembly protein [Serratia marcescens]
MPTIDLSLLPPPNVIEPLDYESLLSTLQQRIIALTDEKDRDAVRAVLALNSDPLTKLTQAYAYRALLQRQSINDAARAVMLAYASGPDLDNLAANFNVHRLTVRAADPTVIPPTPAVMESDSDLRKRTQQAFEGLSVAGPTAAYEFFARSADGKVAHAKAFSPAPACVTVTILSRDGDGTADPALIDKVTAALSDEDTRPIADRLTVQSASIVSYEVVATLHCYPGPEAEPIRQAAIARLQTYINAQHRIGRGVYLSAIDAALSVEGVEHVVITEPKADLVLDKTQASWCTAPQISMAEMND